ncbi:MAG: ferrous iron transport protein B [Planctomycetes bacterium]|nr:ferrous iron transport protein B [Planctomycetota bacterium]
MPSTNETGTITVALLGNPNTGKSTIFNSLAGVRQRVGNYPGVTVEKKIGHAEIGDRQYSLVDLPGTYSLAPHSLDEMVTVDVLLGRRDDVARPNVILCILDASNLQRNLYLLNQTLELQTPTVVALNKMDVAAEQGVKVDVELLSERIGVPIVPMQAHRSVGLDQLKQTISEAADSEAEPHASPFPDVFQAEIASLEGELECKSREPLPRYLIERLLLDSGGYLESAGLPGIDEGVMVHVRVARTRLASAGYPVPAVEAMARYDWVASVMDGAVTAPTVYKSTLSDRIDKLLTHRVLGYVIFTVLMVAVFQSIFSWAEPVMEGIEGAVGWLSNAVAEALPDGAIQSLVVDGLIAGVGGVLAFLPQILILFCFIAMLEDCGYMSRAAYLMDKPMSRIGLSGKSFIPLLSSFACAVPGIQATRVIENRRDRLVTILVAPLMSCSARLPIYTLLTAAFIPKTTYLGGWIGLQGMTMFAMYLLGMTVAVIVAFLLKHTILRGETPAFLMELPGYKVPSLLTVLLRAVENGWSFVRGAGTLIVAVTVVVWAAGYFPHGAHVEVAVRGTYGDQLTALDSEITELQGRGQREPDELTSQRLNELSRQRVELDREINNAVAAGYMKQSVLGRAGKLIEPAVRPLGWDWRIGCAVIASFPAREVVIGTLGVIYHLGEGQDERSDPLRETLQSATWPDTDRPIFNVPVALSVMVFFALCAQCAATLAMIRRETNSWRWPLFTFVYMTTLAYLGALVTYQVGTIFTS